MERWAMATTARSPTGGKTYTTGSFNLSFLLKQLLFTVLDLEFRPSVSIRAKYILTHTSRLVLQLLLLICESLIRLTHFTQTIHILIHVEIFPLMLLFTIPARITEIYRIVDLYKNDIYK